MKTKIKISLLTTLLVVFSASFVLHINYSVENNYNKQIKTIEEIKQNKVGLVLGAGIKNGKPSDIYKDRIKTAIKAYENKKIEKILVSGDNGRVKYDELTPAKLYLYENGVKKEDIFLDYAGFDTYDSLYRAKEIFGNNSLTIFTQEFHLKRALYICEGLEINCLGIKTDLQGYLYSNYYQKREILSRFKAFLNITFNSKPKFLGEKININGKSNYE
ncbi:hypothetical protein EOM39_02475 [Candidatus Gracilibacteria bacterium]|nr:hypothetical protein [Candidatus Gracilibacteria bacterium]